MRAITWGLLGVLGAAGVLWLYSRTRGGRSAAAGAVQGLANIGTGISEDFAAVGNAIGITPRGIRNNNPLNLRFIADPARAWDGQVSNDGGYGVYSSPAMGVRAGSKQLQEDFARGDATLAALIARWAPPTENNTGAYIADVASRAGIDPSAPLDLYANLPAIVAAMIEHENGVQPYSASDLESWVYLS